MLLKSLHSPGSREAAERDGGLLKNEPITTATVKTMNISFERYGRASATKRIRARPRICIPKRAHMSARPPACVVSVGACVSAAHRKGQSRRCACRGQIYIFVSA